MAVSLGYDGLVRPDHWAPIAVTITNGGARLSGRVAVTSFPAPVLGREGATYTVERSVNLSAGESTVVRTSVPIGGTVFPVRVTVSVDGETIHQVSTQGSGVPPDALFVRTSPRAQTDVEDDTDTGGTMYVTAPSVELLPIHPWAYDGLSLLIVDPTEIGRATPAQLTALTRWIASGGALLYTGLREDVPAFLPELMQMEDPRGAVYAGGSLTALLEMAVSDLQSGSIGRPEITPTFLYPSTTEQTRGSGPSMDVGYHFPSRWFLTAVFLLLYGSRLLLGRSREHQPGGTRARAGSFGLLIGIDLLVAVGVFALFGLVLAPPSLATWSEERISADAGQSPVLMIREDYIFSVAEQTVRLAVDADTVPIVPRDVPLVVTEEGGTRSVGVSLKPWAVRTVLIGGMGGRTTARHSGSPRHAGGGKPDDACVLPGCSGHGA